MNFQDVTKQSLHFSRYLLQRMQHDRINVNAGYLTYISLLSLVPMLTVLLSVLSSFSFFNNAGSVIQDFMISNFMPAAGDAVSNALNEFVANTGRMSAMGGAFLFVAALLLISNIDKNLNYIWRVKQKRRAVYSFSMYWMVLTLGPILVGASLAATSFVTSLKIMESEAFSGAYRLLIGWLPFILSLVTFVGLYLLVPNKKVNYTHALAGAVVAAVLFEVSKRGFAFYITNFPSYQIIYGALATIPILFLWVYLCWLIVLVGAEVTASLGESDRWRAGPDVVNSVSGENQQTEQEKGLKSDSADPESK
ncbi:virulence factor BrkB family protein [Vibrio sp. JC009]|uniref:virulence factor BrkB family protein n=1 Tax=Vibrio sp. JC009 TaxID=2912314 RepID=UPI0023B12A9E|nr:virulence factor BrkB family protein [Vibrio sp. JC009]WED21917.1 virulence factor BrkB family protein [Vibrio sp. JC009]